MPTTRTATFADEVGTFMHQLFGLKVSATPIEPADVDPSDLDPPAAVAVYVDGSDFIRGQIACDLRCVAMMGAALTQIPMGAVEDSIENEELSANLKANAYEVFNICVNLFFHQQSSRVVLREVRFGNQAVIADPQRSCNSQDYRINISRYGDGILRMIQC